MAICNNMQLAALFTFIALMQLFSQVNRTELIVGHYLSLPSPSSVPVVIPHANNACGTFPTDTDDPHSKLSSSSSSSPMLRNINIVMVGDSFMRYQYLSLAYRLRHGVWFHESMWYYNLVMERSFESPHHPYTWAEFMFQTNKVLQPMEVCDCFRRAPNKFAEIMENRYFYDPVHNNSVIFLLAFGHVDALKGRLLPNQIRNVSGTWQMDALRERQSHTWIYRDWSRMISGYIQLLDPPPKHVIMNAGMWSHKFGWSQPSTQNNETGQINFPTKSLLRIIQKVKHIQFGWRTTTYTLNRTNRGLEGDIFMCQQLPTCINVSFTSRVRASLYWDGKHFLEPVYRAENEEMLDVLGYLPKDYIRMNLSEILE